MNRIEGLNGSGGVNGLSEDLGDLGKAKKKKAPTPAQIAAANAKAEDAQQSKKSINKIYIFAALALGGALALYFWNKRKGN